MRTAVGAGAKLEVTVLACDAVGRIEAARPEPGARFGRPVRFRLFGNERHVGSATAIVNARLTLVLVKRAVRAGARIGSQDVEETEGDPHGALIERVPAVEEVVNALAVRDLAVGETITGRVARVPPAVRSGERVCVRAFAGRVEARGIATAQQNGRIGDFIRVVNPESRRVLRARIVGRAEVEVAGGSKE